MSEQKYRYTLINAVTGTHICDFAPQEWYSDQCFYERSMLYYGIFRSFSTKSLTFIKDDCAFLKEIKEREGTEGVCTYQVEERNYSNYTYSVIYSGLVDFSTYKYNSKRKIFDSVNIQILDNDFVNTVKTREDLAVSLSKLFDQNGNAITPFSYEGKSILAPQRTDTINATMSSYSLQVTPTTQAFPLTAIYKEDDSIIPVNDITNVTTLAAAFFTSLYATTLTVNLIIQGTVTFASAQSIILRFKRYDKDGTLISTTAITNSGVYSSPWIITLNINDTFTFTFNNVQIGHYIVLEVVYSTAPEDVALTAYQITPPVYTTLSYTKILFTDSTFLGYFYHEAFTRILQSITGVASPFYSDLLGRTDSEIDTYSNDGALSLGVVTNGLLLRGFQFSDTDVGLNIALKELFSSLSAIYPLSLGIETIGGIQKVRIEELTHVFRSDIFLTIENATNITEEVANDLTFNALSFGFSKSELIYIAAKGRYEYNASVNYSTPLTRQQNALSQVASYRADTNGIIGCLSKPRSASRSDNTNFDSDNFLINIVRSTYLQIARADNYSIIGGVENATDTYNLDYQPARNIRRWGSFLRGFLDKYSTKILSFIASKNNSGAYSQRTDESAVVYEGKDIAISDLATPFFENSYYSFDFVVTNDIMTAMAGDTGGVPNYYNLVQFRNNETEDWKYGWVIRFESQKAGNMGLGSLKLLKASASVLPVDMLTESGDSILDESSNNIQME